MPFAVPLLLPASWAATEPVRLIGWLDARYWPAWAETAALAGVVLIAAVIGYAIAVRGINAAERHGRLPASIGFALRKVLRWVTFLIAATLLLQVMGVFESVFTALAGVLTLVAAGFVAFWSVLSNLFCAIILLVARPFMIGDRLTFVGDDVTGTVCDFNLLFTSLKTDDGRMLQVPNNLFFQKMFLRGEGETRTDLATSLEAPAQSVE